MRALFLSVVFLGLLSGASGCTPAPADPPGNTAPPFLLGSFEDDHRLRYTISPVLWHQHPTTRYHIVRWEAEGQYLIARNDAANPNDGDRWTRIDWMELPGMPPYAWAFCLSAYDAVTAAEAEASTLADRTAPRTGCNGFPFSRMKAENPPAGS